MEDFGDINRLAAISGVELRLVPGVDKGCFTVDFSSGKSTEPELVAVGGGDGIVRVMEIGYEENEGGDL